jgi:hypothetical protein
MATFTAVYDACVLYPAPLRDLLMHLALTDLFHARWTNRIHDEWSGSLLRNRPDLDPRQIARTRTLMNSHVLDCMVTGYEGLIESLHLPHAKDRHVLAAAIKAGAEVIVTFNLDHFSPSCLEPLLCEAQHPDEFITRLLDLAPEAVCAAAGCHRQALRKPPKSIEEYLETLLRQGLPKSVEGLRKHAELL